VGVLCALLGAICFSGKAIIVKILYRYPGIDGETLLALRMLVALPFFIIIAAWPRRPDQAALSPRDIVMCGVLGFLGYYLSSYLDFLGLHYVTATLERLILYLSPTLVLMLSVMLRGIRVSRLQMVGLVVSYIGVALAFAHDFFLATSPRPLTGGHLALGSILIFGCAVSYSLYLFGGGELVKRIGAVRMTAFSGGAASVFCIFQYFVLRPMDHWSDIMDFPRPVYALSLVNGTACTVLPIFLLMIAISRIGSSAAAQIGMVGPASTILLAAIFLGEPVGPWQVAGTILVMTGVLVTSKTAVRGVTR